MLSVKSRKLPVASRGNFSWRGTIWENRRSNETRILLFFEPENYLVVLAKRKNYILPWTAYLVDIPHMRRTLLKEYNEYIKSESRL
jgi:hypothetical protein